MGNKVGNKMYDKECNQTIGSRLKYLRKRFEFNQKDIAQYLLISESYYKRIESNKRPLTSDMIIALSDLYGVPTDIILRGIKYE